MKSAGVYIHADHISKESCDRFVSYIMRDEELGLYEMSPALHSALTTAYPNTDLRDAAISFFKEASAELLTQRRDARTASRYVVALPNDLRPPQLHSIMKNLTRSFPKNLPVVTVAHTANGTNLHLHVVFIDRPLIDNGDLLAMQPAKKGPAEEDPRIRFKKGVWLDEAKTGLGLVEYAVRKESFLQNLKYGLTREYRSHGYRLIDNEKTVTTKPTKATKFLKKIDPTYLTSGQFETEIQSPKMRAYLGSLADKLKAATRAEAAERQRQYRSKKSLETLIEKTEAADVFLRHDPSKPTIDGRDQASGRGAAETQHNEPLRPVDTRKSQRQSLSISPRKPAGRCL